MTIRELLDAAGMDRTTVYFYEKEGLIRPERRANGYRDYSAADLAELRRIKLLRRLGVSLEEIRALQAGQRRLPDALTRRLEELERAQAENERARAACRAIRDAGVSYAQLDPDRFAAPPSPAPAAPPFRDAPPPVWCPWRRYFARLLDTALYTLPVIAFLTLVCHLNLVRYSGVYSWIDLIASVLMTLLLEPIFLHLWGATPGKALFGLRLENADGTRLTWRQARGRTWRVLWEGLGLWLPGYSLWRLYKSYEEDRDQGGSAWDREEEFHYIAKPACRRQGAGFVLGMAASFALTVFLVLAAGLPPHTGPLTAEEFVENYNFLAWFEGQPDARLTLDGDPAGHTGLPYQYTANLAGRTGWDEYFRLAPDERTGEMASAALWVDPQGRLTRADLVWAWSNTDYFSQWPAAELSRLARAFAAGEGGWWHSLSLNLSLPDQLARQTAFAPFTLTERKVAMDCQVELEGFRAVDSFLIKEENAACSRGWMTFTVSGTA